METLFKIFEQYGWGGLIGILVCIALFLIGNYLNKKISKNVTTGLEKVGENLTNQISKQNDKLIDKIVTQQDKLLGAILDDKVSDNENHNNMLNERIELAKDINQSIRDIMHIHNAQRILIIEFHNSYKNLSGVPFAKYSCTYEWFDKGLIPIGQACNGLPFSQIANVVDDVLKSKNNQKIYEVESMREENPSLFSTLDITNIKNLVYTGMFDRNNTLIGLLILEYQIPLEEAHLNLEQLKVQTAEITSILNIRYKYMKK